MQKYAKEFPVKKIPHLTEDNEINDEIHTFKIRQEASKNIALDQGKPQLKFSDIQQAMNEIQSPLMARLIGLLCHLTYWQVFGHINQLPIDMYHKKQLFVAIEQILSEIEMKYKVSKVFNLKGKKIFTTFIMPMVVLSIRVEIEIIFKNTYNEFFSVQSQEQVRVFSLPIACFDTDQWSNNKVTGS